MKDIKRAEYNGYKIIIRGAYEEKAYMPTVNGMPTKEVILDTVKIKLMVFKTKDILIDEVVKLELEREDNLNFYNAVTKEIDSLSEKAIKVIDKKVREEKITEGLPESLLSISKNEEAEEEEENSVDLILNFMYMAMKDLGYTLEDLKKGEPKGDIIEGFAKKLADNLKSQKGLA